MLYLQRRICNDSCVCMLVVSMNGRINEGVAYIYPSNIQASIDKVERRGIPRSGISS